jgi:lipoprotein NlpD
VASAGSVSAGASGAIAAPAAGIYVVKPGDTLIRIGLDNGQNWRDVARWNNIENPNLIEVGQVLRVVPPGQDPTVATARPVPAPGRLESRPLEARSAAPPGGSVAPGLAAERSSAPAAAGATAAATVSNGPAAAGSAVAGAPAGAGGAVAATASSGPRQGDEGVDWAWPAAGMVATPFDEARGVKGLSIVGKAGDPVLAAADGRVVYAGSGLRGYGNLVIVKHNSTFLTAYAHNQTLLVKEDQAVRRGQRIAEMGSSDADQVKLHFEIRRLGKPVDPARLLPAR